MSTAVCPSTDVVKYSLAMVGMVVLRGINTLTIPPRVSMPRDRGVTSRRSMSVIPPARIWAWTAAPRATTSSGLSWLCGVLPKSSCTRRLTRGTRVEPPTSTISSICPADSPASSRAIRQGPRVASTRGAISPSTSLRVMSRR